MNCGNVVADLACACGANLLGDVDPVVAAIARYRATAAIFVKAPSDQTFLAARQAFERLCKVPTTSAGAVMTISILRDIYREWNDTDLFCAGMVNVCDALKRLQQQT